MLRPGAGRGGGGGGGGLRGEMAAAEGEEGCLGLAANAEVLALLRTRAAEAGGESELSGGDRRLMEYLKGVPPPPLPPPFGVTLPCPARSSVPPARAMVLPSLLPSTGGATT